MSAEWSPTAFYKFGDVVTYQGAEYALIVAGNTPSAVGVAPANNVNWITPPPPAPSTNQQGASSIVFRNITSTTAVMELVFPVQQSAPSATVITLTSPVLSYQVNYALGLIYLYGLTPSTTYGPWSITFGTNAQTYSNTFVTGPPPPTPIVGVVVSAVTNTSCTISWNGGGDPALGDYVFLFNNLEIVPSSLTGNALSSTANFNTLIAATTYSVVIFYTDSLGNTVNSSPVVFTTSGSPPVPPPITQPVIANFTNVSPSSFRVNWTGGSSFANLYSFTLNGTPTVPTSVTSSNAVFSGLTASTTYSVVVSVSNGVTSLSSTPASVTTSSSGTPIAPIGNVQSSNITASGFTITWTGGSTSPADYSFTLNSVVTVPSALSASSATFTALNTNTTYSVIITANNGTTSVNSAPLLVTTSSSAPFQTLCHMTFLVPVVGFGFSTTAAGKLPINNSIYWGMNADAPNGTANQTYGNFGCKSYTDNNVSPLNGGAGYAVTTLDTTGLCFNDNGIDYTTVSNNYLGTVKNSPNTKLIMSLGGFYADILGMFGPYRVPGVVNSWVSGTGSDLIDSINFALYNNTSSANPLGWSRSGWGAITWDGLNLDFENVGFGGLQTNGPWGNSQYPPPQSPLPSFPADAGSNIPGTSIPYSSYVTALKNMVIRHYTNAPTKILTMAPVSLCINQTVQTNICASNNALNTWAAFPSVTTVPSAATYLGGSSDALIHPTVMSYFNDVFVQFYNEQPADYLGGANFNNILAQWGYVALLAQQQGRRNVRINVGLACGQMSAIVSQAPPPPLATFPPTANPTYANAGPTAPFAQGGAPVGYNEFWYPQFGVASPPNDPSFTANSPATDPTLLQSALAAATQILQGTFPGITTASWCSGAGFFAGKQATQMAKNVYNSTSPFYVPGLPAGYTYLWAEAYYPAVEPGWLGNVPVVVQ